ncbi:hypothetical protein EHQ30_11250 [Leptospira brenneri]|uniref:Uncharacterized protein n=1 Tax=Leptospira brenneri TaxID=2023182 RepID=A0A5F1Z5D5_9LEPT|nr:hypothetical protein [Leptospira brenneri]TGK92806.1 hypothetical protein EHQ30_11250 [Leptospira brenneri]
METTFLSDSVFVKAGTFNDYLMLFGIVFWTGLALSGFWVWKQNHIGKIGPFFTLLMFLPFSFMCFKSYEDKELYLYQLVIDKNKEEIRFGDSRLEPDIVFPFAEFISYQIKSESESKKDGRLYTDTVYLNHKSGLLLPVATVSVRKYNDSSESFSRYTKLSKEFRKLFRIFPLPVETETGKPFQELLVKPKLSNEKPEPNHIQKEKSNTNQTALNEKSEKESIRPPQFPIEWNHHITNANWYFSLSLIAIGNLGLFLFVVTIRAKDNPNWIWGLVLLLLGYLSFGAQYYFWIGEKQETQYRIESSKDRYLFSSLKDGKVTEEKVWIQNSEKIAFLELPGKTLHIQTKLAYEKAKALANSLENPDSNLEDAFKLTKEVYQASDGERWDLSDLPMEVAVRLFLVL